MQRFYCRLVVRFAKILLPVRLANIINAIKVKVYSVFF